MQHDPSLLIMVIDDEPPVIDLLKRVGGQIFPEAEFISTDSPQQTLDYLANEPGKHPQMILLDIDLHHSLNGIELIPSIRKLMKTRVPVIMFTISDAEPDIRDAYNAGAVAYTRKPESLAGWQDYVSVLKEYWYKTNLLPDPSL